jgi:hypothetical protein
MPHIVHAVTDIFRRSASYVDRILKAPADRNAMAVWRRE